MNLLDQIIDGLGYAARWEGDTLTTAAALHLNPYQHMQVCSVVCRVGIDGMDVRSLQPSSGSYEQLAQTLGVSEADMDELLSHAARQSVQIALLELQFRA